MFKGIPWARRLPLSASSPTASTRAATADTHGSVANPAEPLPVPEILVPGYSSMNERFLNTLHQFMEQHISDNNLSIDEIAEV